LCLCLRMRVGMGMGLGVSMSRVWKLGRHRVGRHGWAPSVLLPKRSSAVATSTKLAVHYSSPPNRNWPTLLASGGLRVSKLPMPFQMLGRSRAPGARFVLAYRLPAETERQRQRDRDRDRPLPYVSNAAHAGKKSNDHPLALTSGGGGQKKRLEV
jgi:hypothetical protein